MPKTTISDIAELECALRVANRLYYDDPDNARLSDKDFDAMHDKLRKLCPDSPVLQERSNYDRDIQHTRLVGSWDKCHTEDEVLAHFGKAGPLFLTPKIDGASITLYYENGRLVLGATRGDSATGKGKDITANAVMIEGVPSSIPMMGPVEVKGEAYIPKVLFFGTMDQPGFGGKKDGLANPRNAAAGGIMAKNPYETRDRKVHFIAYGLHAPEGQPFHKDGMQTFSGRLQQLAIMGFTTPQSLVIGSPAWTKADLELAIAELGHNEHAYEIDGVVILLDYVDMFERKGVSGICPQGGLAFKFKTETAQTELVDVEWRALRTGKVRPRGRVRPVKLGGSTVEYLTLNNATWLRAVGACLGDTITIEKANEIIPKLVSVDKRVAKRNTNEPTLCPACGTELVLDGADLYCRSTECPAKVTEATQHMLEKLDVKGIGPGFIEKMADGGVLESPTDIFNLSQDALVKIGFGKGQAGIIVDAVSNLVVSKAQQLAALGIPGWGRRLFGMLFQSSTITYEDLVKFPLDSDLEKRLAAVPQLGPKRAHELFDGLMTRQLMLNSLRAATKLEADKPKPKANSGNLHPCNGKRFCATGTMSRTRGEIHALIMGAGGVAEDAVTKNLDYLIVGEKAGSKLAKAQKLGVKILSESEFMGLIGVQ